MSSTRSAGAIGSVSRKRAQIERKLVSNSSANWVHWSPSSPSQAFAMSTLAIGSLIRPSPGHGPNVRVRARTWRLQKPDSARARHRLRLRVRIDPGRANKHGGMALVRHLLVKRCPLAFGAAHGSGIYGSQQPWQVRGCQPLDEIPRPDELGATIHRNPIPSDTPHHGDVRTGAEVVEFASMPASHETDDRRAVEGIVEHAGVDHRRVRSAVGATGDRN